MLTIKIFLGELKNWINDTYSSLKVENQNFNVDTHYMLFISLPPSEFIVELFGATTCAKWEMDIHSFESNQ